MIRNKISFYGEELSAPRPTPKLEDHPLSALGDCLFNIFAATLHTRGCSSIRNLRSRHPVVTGAQLSRQEWTVSLKKVFKESSSACINQRKEGATRKLYYFLQRISFVKNTNVSYAAYLHDQNTQKNYETLSTACNDLFFLVALRLTRGHGHPIVEVSTSHTTTHHSR